MNKIVAIVGMTGAGKSVAVDYFESLNYQKVYFGGITFEKLKEEGIEVTPENEKAMREGLRDKYGMGAYAILSLPKIRDFYEVGDVVIDGLYSWDELKILKDEFGSSFTVIAIVADRELRYKRLSTREARPSTRENAVKRDIAEIEFIAKGGPIAFADYFVLNNKEEQDLINRLDEILDNLKNNC